MTTNQICFVLTGLVVFLVGWGTGSDTSARADVLADVWLEDSLVKVFPDTTDSSLPDDTPVKVEVGAIGADDNATFSEEDGFCVNEVLGCED